MNKNTLFKGLTKDTFLLALTSFFADISTEMLYPVLPIFLTQTLKASAGIVGLVEGVAEATQNIIQGFSGSISDKLRKRKNIAVLGYSLAAVSKPLIGLSSVWQFVLGTRFLDRMGTGIRSAPRDALIASSADTQNTGKAFGLEGIGDNFGAFVGPLVAIVLIFTFGLNLRHVFYIAFIPGLMAVIMVLLVKEKDVILKTGTNLNFSLKRLPKLYWKYILVTILFGLGNSSNSFLILRTKNIGVSLEETILVYAFFNLVAAFASYPAGMLSDKIGRRNILLISFLIFFVTYLGFAVSTDIILIILLFIFYGLYQGIFRSVGKALATDLVPLELRASGVGWYSTAVGLTSLFASVVGGQLWTMVNPSATFYFGACSAIIGSAALLLLFPKR